MANQVVSRDDIPALASALESTLLNHYLVSDAISPFVNVNAIPRRFRPIKTFLMALDTTIKIPMKGDECRFDERTGEIIMCSPGELLSINDWFGVCLHECCHAAEQALSLLGSTDLSELRADVGSAILIRLLGLKPVSRPSQFLKWIEHWKIGIQNSDTYALEAVRGGIQCAQWLIKRAVTPKPMSLQRWIIIRCFNRLMEYCENEEAQAQPA